MYHLAQASFAITAAIGEPKLLVDTLPVFIVPHQRMRLLQPARNSAALHGEYTRKYG
jgi:hypothetical protein